MSDEYLAIGKMLIAHHL